MSNNGHIWDQISTQAKHALAQIKVPGFGNPPQGYNGSGQPHIPAALIPHWVLTEYDALSALLSIDEAGKAADAKERDSKLRAAADAARRIRARMVMDNPIA